MAPQSNSVLSLVGQAGPIVQMVLYVLMGFSVVTWAIILRKYFLFRGASASSRKFLEVFWASRSLDAIFTESKKFRASPVSTLFQSGYAELQKLVEFRKYRKDGKEAAKTTEGELTFELSGIDNIERALGKASNAENSRFERMNSFLATTGSTAPFIGLFGTVWGIMDAFQSIGEKGSASLAVVAPGIAEALVATAVGLAAAIPAVMGYNYFLTRMKSLRMDMENFSSDFLNIVKRNFFVS